MKSEIKHTEDTLSAQIICMLDELGQMASRAQIPLNLYTADSVEHLKSLPEEQKLRMLSQQKSYNEIFEVASKHFSPVTDWGLGEEFHCLNAALWKYNLFPKVDLKDYIGSGDVIEIYNRNAVQIYRNFEFIKLCSYSLLEVMTLEWFVLYDRPQSVTEQLFKHVGAVFETSEIVKIDIPEHVMREKHLTARKTFINQFKYFIPLYEKGDPVPAAFVAVMQVTPVLSEGEGLNLAMLERKAN